MTQQHTPGPWAADFEDGTNVGGMVLMAIKTPQGLPVALIPCRPVDNPKAHPHLVADALLIAAAPELLAALEGLLATEDDPSEWCYWCAALVDREVCISDDCPGVLARAAIAKATGPQAR